MQQLADRVGVSKMSISLYLKDRNTTRVGSAVKKTIDEAIEELHYVLPSSRQGYENIKSIGIIVPLESSRVFSSDVISRHLDGVQQQLRLHGYNMVFLLSHIKENNSLSVDQNSINACEKCSGVILFATRHSTERGIVKLIDYFTGKKMPVALLNYPYRMNRVIQGIYVNDSNCNPTKYLISLGHKKILFMGGNQDAAQSKILLDEYKNVLEENGIEYNPELVLNGNFENYQAYTELTSAIRKGICFSAIYCISTPMCLGCYRALNENRIRIPDDVSVVNYGLTDYSDFLNPSLTTVRLAAEEIGKQVALRLVEVIEQGKTEVSEIITKPNSLSVCQSTTYIGGDTN